jgi:hypothetical protein
MKKSSKNIMKNRENYIATNSLAGKFADDNDNK